MPLENTLPIGDLDVYKHKARKFYGHKIGVDSSGNQIDIFDIILELAGEQNVPVYNASGASIAANTLVYFSNYNTTYSCPEITKAQGTNTGKFAEAIVDEAIANGAEGFVRLRKYITSLNTDSYTVGDPVYLSDDTAGAYDFTKPTGTDKVQIVGRVIDKHASAGAIKLEIESTQIVHTHADNSEGGQLGDTIFNGTVTSDDGTTPALICYTGNTNTGYVEVQGKTNGAVRLTTADSTGNVLTLSCAAIATSNRTVTLPDPGGTDTVTYNALAATLTNKTLTTPVINGASSASGNFDISGSSGTFKSCTGANTLGGAVTVDDAANPDLTLASGKTNTGVLTISGKTSGTLKFTTNDSTAQAVTVTAAAQTSGDVTLTIPDMAGANDTFVFLTDTQTLTNKTLTTPTIGDLTNMTHDHSNAANGGSIALTMTDLGSYARGSMIRGGGSDWEAFTVGTTNQLLVADGTDVAWGDPAALNAATGITIGGATTPCVSCATGKTNTGYLEVLGKTSGGVRLTCADAAGNKLIMSAAAVATSDRTLTLPDPGGADSVTYNALAATLTNKTLTTPVINGASSASGNFDISGSSGTFKSCTGANTLGGAVTVDDAANPNLTLASGKTNTGILTINGKTSGALALTTADASGNTLTVSAAATAGSVTLTLPDPGGADSVVYNDLAATLTNKTLTTPTIGDFTNAGHDHMDAAGGAVLDHYAYSMVKVTDFVEGDATNVSDTLTGTSTPEIDHLDGDTDSALGIKWVAGNQDPITCEFDVQFIDSSVDLVIYFDGKMSGATDTPAIDVDVYFDRGDTKVSDASSALGSSWAEESITVGNADIPSGAKRMTVEWTPQAHAADDLWISQVYAKYKKTNIGSSS